MPNLCALWVSGSLSYIEQLCPTSALDVGHRVALYTYGGVPNAPDGVDLRDGREIMPESDLVVHRRSNSVAVGTVLFRYHMLQKVDACYIDCDLLFVKPMQNADYIFGLQSANRINNAILRAPMGSNSLVDILLMIYSKPFVAPWWHAGRKLTQWIYWLYGAPKKIEDLEWGVTGPRALTYFASKNGLARHAADVDVFYPNPWQRAANAFDPEIDFSKCLTSKTVAVHLWNERIKQLKQAPPPPGSFIDQHCRRLGISVD